MNGGGYVPHLLQVEGLERGLEFWHGLVVFEVYTFEHPFKSSIPILEADR